MGTSSLGLGDFRDVLSRLQDCWYLASWDAATGRGFLSVGPLMPRNLEFTNVSDYRDVLVIDSLESLSLFPSLRFKGYQVVPRAWKTRTTEPVLSCWVNIPSVDNRGRTREQILRELAVLESQYRVIVPELTSLGRKFDLREGGEGYLHVDQLEKLEHWTSS